MTIEKNRKITELIRGFLGHEPSSQEKKQFRIMNRLGESLVYHKGMFVGTVRYDAGDDVVT